MLATTAVVPPLCGGCYRKIYWSKNIQDTGISPRSVHMRFYQTHYKGHPGQIKRGSWIYCWTAKKPMVFIRGGGVVLGNAAEQLRTFVNIFRVSGYLNAWWLSSHSMDDKQFLGMLGMQTGTMIAICDALIVTCADGHLVARFDEFEYGKNCRNSGPHGKIIHIDIDPSSISKNYFSRTFVGWPMLEDVLALIWKSSAGKQVKTPTRSKAVVRQCVAIIGWMAVAKKNACSYDHNKRDQIQGLRR